MLFDVAAKYGRYWVYITTIHASNSIEACRKAKKIYGRKKWGAKPADTCLPYYKYTLS